VKAFANAAAAFAQMLNEMRLGRISDGTVRSFKSMARPLAFDDGLEVTEL
jgi:ATP-dependent DNA helicase PIF1